MQQLLSCKVKSAEVQRRRQETSANANSFVWLAELYNISCPLETTTPPPNRTFGFERISV